MTELKISVVIPVFERPVPVCRALDSVLAQTVAPREIICVDDGSGDNTRAIVRSQYPDAKLIDSGSPRGNRGVSAARNRGIRAAGSDWIALLDSDDTWHPDKLEQQIERAMAADQPRVIHTDEIWIRDGVRVNQGKRHKKQGGWIYSHCLPLCAMSPSSIMIHRDVFESAGLFDESLPACEDYDLWLRICARYPVAFIARALVTKYGGHSDQLSRRYQGMDRFRISALNKVLESGVLSAADHALTVQMLEQKLRIYRAGAARRGRQEEVRALDTLGERWAISWA